jgi:hypothetical protein
MHLSRLLSEFSGTRLIIILDEFDRVAPGPFQAEIAELIKNLADASARVQLIIAGVAANLRELLGHSPSIRRNIAAIAVEEMGNDEVRELIAIGERHAGFSFTPDAAEHIVAVAAGRPHIARLLCHGASLRACAEHRTVVEMADVRTALANVSSDAESRLPPRSRDTLRHWIDANPRALLELARAALSLGSHYSTRGAAPTLSSESEDLARQLASADIVRAITVDENTTAYEFTDESAQVFVLLEAARALAR